MTSSQPPVRLTAEQAIWIRNRCIFTSLRRASRAVSRLYDEAVRPLGLGITQFELLMVLRIHGSMRVSDLAAELGTDQTTVSRNVRLLRDKGCVHLDVASLDARERVLSLTAKARRLLERCAPLWEEAQVRVEEALGSTRTLRLRSDLDRVVEASID